MLYNLSDASLFINTQVMQIDLNRANEDEDSYYLQEFYNKKDEKRASPIKVLTGHTRTKTVLPMINSRAVPSRPY